MLLTSMLGTGLRLFPPHYLARMVSQRGVVAPCYHLIADRAPAHIRHLYQCRDERAFRDDLDYLLKRFHPLSLAELHTCIASGRPVPARSLFLSFDDGFREMSEVVAPICRSKGVPATFFLTTGFLDNQLLGYRQQASLLIDASRHRGRTAIAAATAQLAEGLRLPPDQPVGLTEMLLAVRYRQRHLLEECAAILEVDFSHYLKTAQPYLSWAQVQKLVDDGFAIGGHSIDHPRYAELALDEQIAQTSGCLETLSARYPVPVKAFAFPFVSDGVSEQFFEELFARDLADLLFCIGQMPESGNRRAIQRFGVEAPRHYSLAHLLRQQAEGHLRQKAAIWKRRVLVSQ